MYVSRRPKPPCWSRNRKVRSAWRRVFMAVYITADAEGRYSTATNAEIAAVAGLNAETVKTYLSSMNWDGVFAVYDVPKGVRSRRVIVIPGHPDTPELVESLERIGRRRIAFDSMGNPYPEAGRPAEIV